METSFKTIIDEAKAILVLLPTKPYFDQVAAGLSLYLSLRDKKDVTITCPSPMTVEFNRLIGVNKISQEMGNKNLVIRFVDYKANDIERVSYDIENGQFKLSVIPKPRVTAPTKEQLDISYSGVNADTVILIGGANEYHFPEVNTKDLASSRLVHVGNRDLNLGEKRNFISLAKAASSVSELVAMYIKEGSLTLDQDIATNLLMGIEEGTEEFTGENVTADTFATIADLMKHGGKRLLTQAPAQPAAFPVGAIPGGFPSIKRPPMFPQPGVLPMQSMPGMSQMPQPGIPMSQQIRTRPQQPQIPQRSVQSLQQQNQPKREPSPREANDISEDEAPTDWLQPKIFSSKGNSIS